MERRNVDQLNVDLQTTFSWRVEVADQENEFEAPGQHLKLYRLERTGKSGYKKVYVGPMPIEMPDFAIYNAGWLCRDYYLLGYKQARRDEERLRRKKRSRRP